MQYLLIVLEVTEADTHSGCWMTLEQGAIRYELLVLSLPRLRKWFIFDHHLPKHLSFPAQALHKFTLTLKINTMSIVSSSC